MRRPSQCYQEPCHLSRPPLLRRTPFTNPNGPITVSATTLRFSREFVIIISGHILRGPFLRGKDEFARESAPALKTSRLLPLALDVLNVHTTPLHWTSTPESFPVRCTNLAGLNVVVAPSATPANCCSLLHPRHTLPVVTHLLLSLHLSPFHRQLHC